MTMYQLEGIKKGLDWAVKALPNPPGSVSKYDFCRQVFANASGRLVKSLSSPVDEKLRTCHELRESIKRLDQQADCSKGLSETVCALVDLVFLKAFCTDATVGLTRALEITDDPSNRMTLAEFLDVLEVALDTFVSLQSVNNFYVPDDELDQLKDKVFKYIAANRHEKPDKVHSVQELFFRVTRVRWELDALKACTIDDPSSSRAVVLLSGPSSFRPDGDLQILSSVRNLLFVEKRLYSYILTRLTSDGDIALKGLNWLQKGATVSLSKGALLFTLAQDDLVELGLMYQTHRVCEKLVNGDKSRLWGLLQKIHDYSLQKEAKVDVVNLCHDLLVVNELLFLRKSLDEEWVRLMCTAPALLYVDEAHHLFTHKSSLPRERCRYLFDVASALGNDDYPQFPQNAQDFANVQIYSITFLRILSKHHSLFVNEEDTKLYGKLSSAISECLQVCRNRLQKAKEYLQIRYTDADRSVGWDVLDEEAYGQTLEEIRVLFEEGRLLETPQLYNKLRRNAETNTTDKGYLVSLPQPPRKSPTKKQPSPKTPPSVARSPTRQDQDVVALVRVVEKKLTLKNEPARARPASPPIRIEPLLKVAEFEVASRVADWFNPTDSQDHPFVKEPKYRDGKFSLRTKTRICIEHAFAWAVNDCLGEAIPTKDKALLTALHAKKRLQLIGQIQVGQEVINGVFTYTFGDALFHRCFTEEGHKEVLNPGAQSALEVLKAPEHNEPSSGKRGKVKDDGSQIVEITQNFITISDPKFDAIIKILRTKLFKV